jgi:hypothetical protein
MGTFDGRSLRTSPTTPSLATVHSALNNDVPPGGPETISLAANSLRLESGLDEDLLSQVGSIESSRARNSRSFCSVTGILDDYAMRS